jgi:hypothetical protein
MADKAAPSRSFDLCPFENIAAEPLNSEKLANDDSATPYVQLLAWQITKLTQNGLKALTPSIVGNLGGSSYCNIVIT